MPIHSAILKTRDLLQRVADQGIQSFYQVISDLNKTLDGFLMPGGLEPTTEQFRAQINAFVTKVVHQITGAECVFVRKMNTDGSATLANDSLHWFPESEQVGRPPLVKPKSLGISTYALHRGDTSPLVVADVLAAPLEVKESHERTLCWACSEDPKVQAFVRYIRAEVCIPLRVKGKTFAGIIAICGTPYDPDTASRILNDLQWWQQILSFLYWVGLELHHETRLGHFMASIGHITHSVATSPTDDDFLRKMVTVFTCEKGLEWHRALVFAFDGPYPSDAKCVMAVGGSGDTDWSRTQASLTFTHDSLDDYLISTEISDYAADDSLFSLSQKKHGLVIPRSCLTRHPTLRASFSVPMDEPIWGSRDDSVVWLDKGEPWLDSIPAVEQAFPVEMRSGCDRCLIPLIDVRSCSRESVGFLILDNPYPHFVETHYTEGLARLLCDLFVPHLTRRGFGKAGWIDELYAIRDVVRSLSKRSESALSPQIRAQAEEYLRTFHSPSG
jgi:hypothetical protein